MTCVPKTKPNDNDQQRRLIKLGEAVRRMHERAPLSPLPEDFAALLDKIG